MESTYYSEYIGIFLEEAEEQLQVMGTEILHLEQFGASEASIQNLFRATHTLKGSSAAMGFQQIKDLTHSMEHILDQVRGNRLYITHSLIDLLFKCLDHLQQLKQHCMSKEGAAHDITFILAELEEFVAQAAGGTAPVKAEAAQLSIPLGFDEKIRLEEIKASGALVVEISVQIKQDCTMKLVRAFVVLYYLYSWGEVVVSEPSLQEGDLALDDDSCPDELRFILAISSEVEADLNKLQNGLMNLMDVVTANVTLFIAYSLQDDTELAEESGFIPLSQQAIGEQANLTNSKSPIPSIRVDVERLDHMMNLVGELVIDQTRIMQVSKILNQRYSLDQTVDELGIVSDHVSRIIAELQESVMKVRMLPIGQLFHRFQRMVRDLSKSINKNIEIHMEGEETELDRTVIEEISDPLIHLLRNAVDHGIESAEARIAAGKPAKGSLRIIAEHAQNQVVLTVQDDGAGIDPFKMRENAIRKGILSEEEAHNLSDRESIALIFRPGFSTAKEISDLSGRGVGMDIVRSHIQKLNGMIDVDTKLGEGTQFIIKLLLTLAIIPGLLFKLQTSTYIIPMSSVVEIVRVAAQQIQFIKGEPIVVIRDQIVPIYWLHDYFQINRFEQSHKPIPLIVIGVADKRIALVVDELLGNQEVVVKAMGAYISKDKGISGATILGDGRVALILEAAGIAKMIGFL